MQATMQRQRVLYHLQTLTYTQHALNRGTLLPPGQNHQGKLSRWAESMNIVSPDANPCRIKEERKNLICLCLLFKHWTCMEAVKDTLTEAALLRAMDYNVQRQQPWPRQVIWGSSWTIPSVAAKFPATRIILFHFTPILGTLQRGVAAPREAGAVWTHRFQAQSQTLGLHILTLGSDRLRIHAWLFIYLQQNPAPIVLCITYSYRHKHRVLERAALIIVRAHLQQPARRGKAYD